ncbi:MAG: hypothetical protein AAGJ40_02925 [Planctomycetota bacterium]
MAQPKIPQSQLDAVSPAVAKDHKKLHSYARSLRAIGQLTIASLIVGILAVAVIGEVELFLIYACVLPGMLVTAIGCFAASRILPLLVRIEEYVSSS